MKRILIVDDDQSFSRVLSRTLQLAGYAVVTAENGTIALRIYQAEPVDLVITDLIMPDKEGFETIIELRRLNPDLKIIAMSGGGRVDAGDYLPVAKSLGASMTLTKPFTADEVRQAVSSLLS